jgi:hypothetical protein
MLALSTLNSTDEWMEKRVLHESRAHWFLVKEKKSDLHSKVSHRKSAKDTQ